MHTATVTWRCLQEKPRQATHVQRNIKARSCKHSCYEKAIGITYSECVFVALAIQHAMRMYPVILSSGACRALQQFSALSHKRHDSRKKLPNIKGVF